jgi:hypothetical protein
MFGRRCLDCDVHLWTGIAHCRDGVTGGSDLSPRCGEREKNFTALAGVW